MQKTKNKNVWLLILPISLVYMSTKGERASSSILSGCGWPQLIMGALGLSKFDSISPRACAIISLHIKAVAQVMNRPFRRSIRYSAAYLSSHTRHNVPAREALRLRHHLTRRSSSPFGHAFSVASIGKEYQPLSAAPVQ